MKARVFKETGKGLKSNNIYFDSAWCLIRSIPCYKAIVHQGDIVSVPACSIYCIRSFENGVLLRWEWSTRDKTLFDTCVEKNRRISKQKLKWKSEMYDNLVERRNMVRDSSRRVFCWCTTISYNLKWINNFSMSRTKSSSNLTHLQRHSTASRIHDLKTIGVSSNQWCSTSSPLPLSHVQSTVLTSVSWYINGRIVQCRQAPLDHDEQ